MPYYFLYEENSDDFSFYGDEKSLIDYLKEKQ